MAFTISWGLRKQFYQQASSQLDNGLTITAVLGDFRARLLRRKRTKAAERFDAIHRRVADGDMLTTSLGSSLSALERSVLSSGEQAGALSRSMRLVLEVRAMTDRLTNQLRSSFFAPSVYLVSLYVVLYIIGDYIVPQFTAAVPIEKWTGWAYVMYQMGQLAVGWAMPLLFGSLMLAIGWTIWALPRWTHPSRAFFDRHIFPFTVYREVQGFAWLLSFVALLRAGVPDTVALKGQIASASPWLATRLRPILTGLEIHGLDMAAAMRRSGLQFPSLDLIDEIGAYVGFENFAEKIEAVSREYAQTLERKLLFKGALISAIFSAVTFFAFVVLQLGANAISSILTTSMGAA
ncbi:type II secretion system protein [Burkholderia territorii]|uniref:type II secretion system F family protein n=1 Tax=Burkholderia territorii TaxID=1503055 RepID=UPI0007574071|nr:type II secretion system F family protein [Burkholderia territorii]KVX33870.1 type II secretion system protein [Burkholderia territorii]